MTRYFWAGLALGLLMGLACIHHGMQQAREARPPFPVITGAHP